MDYGSMQGRFSVVICGLLCNVSSDLNHLRFLRQILPEAAEENLQGPIHTAQDTHTHMHCEPIRKKA